MGIHKKYRMYYENINNGHEFYIDVNNSDDIQKALNKRPEYLADPDSWECFDQEEINKHIIYTHNEAAGIVNLFEEILDKHNIKIPSPEDDECSEDNSAALYGTVYGNLLDEVETILLEIIFQVQHGETDIVAYEFSGND